MYQLGYHALATSFPRASLELPPETKPENALKRIDSVLDLYSHSIDPANPPNIRDCLGLYVRPYGIPVESLYPPYILLASAHLRAFQFELHPSDLKRDVDRCIVKHNLSYIVKKAEFKVGGGKIYRYLFDVYYQPQVMGVIRSLISSNKGSPEIK